MVVVVVVDLVVVTIAGVVVVPGLEVVATVEDGAVVLVVGEPAAASLHAEISNTPASNDVALRPAMCADHTKPCHAVRLTMLTIHVTITIDTDTDQESGTILAERLKDLVWKEVYENMQLPASTATGYAEHG